MIPTLTNAFQREVNGRLRWYITVEGYETPMSVDP